MRAGIAVVLFVGLSLFVAPHLLAEDAAEYLPPEHFASNNRQAEYLPHATAFLEAHPNDPRASRIALDMLMVATLRNDTAATQAAQLRLLIDYSGSLPTDYFLKSTPANTVSSLLVKHFQEAQPFSPEDMKRFGDVIDRCVYVHGAGFGDNDLRLQRALAAQDMAAMRQIVSHMHKPNENIKKTLMAAYHERLTDVQRFLALQELRDYKTAQAYQRYVYEHLLQDGDRAQPKVKFAVAQNLLREREFAKALPILTELRAVSRAPQIAFLQAWAQAASGDIETALQTLEKLQQESPASPYAAVAKELAGVLTDLDDNLAAHTDSLDKAFLNLLATAPEVVAATISFKWKERPAAQVYLALDVARDGIEIIASSEDKPVLAYRAMPEDCRYFFNGDSTIHAAAANGFCPTFTAKLETTTAGKLNFNFWFNTVPQGSGGLSRSVREMLSMPVLASVEKRHELLRAALRRGSFPCTIQQQDGQRVLKWITPEVDEPLLDTITVKLTDQHRLQSVVGKQWSVQSIQYGPRNTLLIAPPWPDLPVQQVAEFAASDLFRLFGAMMSLVEEESAKEARKDAEPAPVKR